MSAGAISNVYVSIGTRMDKLRTGLAKAQSMVQQAGAKMQAKAQGIGAKLGGALGSKLGGGLGKAVSLVSGELLATSTAGLALGAGFAVAAGAAAATAGSMALIYKMTQSSVEAASALNETVSKTHTLLGSQVGGDVEAFAKGLQKAGKVGARQAMESVTMVANSLTNQGVGLGESADLGKMLTTRAADIASQDNMSVDEVLEKIRSGLAGESEPLRSLGIYISAEEAKKSGMSFGQYAANAILKQSQRAEGDQDRTGGSLANMQRAGSIRLEAAMESLGASFMVFHQAIEMVKGRIIAAFLAISENPAFARLGAALAQISLNLTNWFTNVFGGPVMWVINAFVNVLTWAFEKIAWVTQAMENYTVAPLTTFKLAILTYIDTLIWAVNIIPEIVKSYTGINFSIDRSGLKEAMAKYEQDIRDAGGYKGQDQVKKLQDANKAPSGDQKAALQTGGGKAGEEQKSSRSSFTTLLADAVGGMDKKYQKDMLTATQEIAANTKPNAAPGVQPVASVGTLKTNTKMNVASLAEAL